ncbi:LON peptidase N-terminal domain and RING finger protein 1 isoform X1 [Scleropages formosus]|uniref:LON peptidase N-terminal domain and RING finger protein 1 isoform X1 n=1 Tax=Scleropages formosus TaxID=113540 RepID=UPI0010FA768E|nr:LON peptidase N-terminal domain and RING finger protein 1-like isoform X1 [Scleropages formosus]XP_029113438.1 LON peptidase N-terminal domain and RING finger protein 1-like isoform X1 [Scleropages formosus]
MDLLECPLCAFLLCEPVTVSCGHSLCRRCALTSQPCRCPVCAERLRPRDLRGSGNNVLLSGLLEKVRPQEMRLRGRVLERLRGGEFAQAARIASEGIQLAPGDLGLKVWRAEANMGLQHFSDALQDLDELCRTCPTWTEGFFRKGNVLLEMGRQSDALFQYHRCLKLQADFVPARNQIKKVLEAEGVQVPEDVPRLLQLVSERLRDPSPITSSVSPTIRDGSRCPLDVGQDPEGLRDSKKTSCSVKHTTHTSAECCLSLCQAVSFLPTAEDDEELMMRRDERTRKGPSGQTSQEKEMFLNVLTVSDFECPLCIRLFYEPVTTPCGHTFCKNCIERSLDHNLRCPLCKQPLHEYLKNRKYKTTVLLEKIMSQLFPQQLAERRQVHDAEMAELSNLTKDIPIFVCTVAYPGVPCPLHVFEPRYRLMMRRCMETGTKKFGMCTYEPGKGFADYGCMLEILGLDLLPDGRSYVDTIGGGRFRVLKRGQRDGYHTADIEFLEDQRVEGAELELLQRLHDSVYQQAQEWYRRLSGRIQEQISRRYGPMPEKEDNIQESSNGPVWCWWLLSVLQLDPTYQTTVLSLTSLKDRLSHLRIVLEYFCQA